MRDKLIQYVNFLFAGAPDAEEVKQEILQNTLDRFDDLITQGKTPEAAYSLAISGIGDISEILGTQQAAQQTPQAVSNKAEPAAKETPIWRKLMCAAAVFLYIICIIPLIVLSEFGMETIGLCATLAVAALATALIIIASGNSAKKHAEEKEDELEKPVKSLVDIITICVYLGVSFLTGAWWITWLIFPIAGAVKGLIKACIDLREVRNCEK